MNETERETIKRWIETSNSIGFATGVLEGILCSVVLEKQQQEVIKKAIKGLNEIKL